MNSIQAILKKNGPCRSSVVVGHLAKKGTLSELAARQRLSRAGRDVVRFPVQLLPNKEKFVYLKGQERTEKFWVNLLTALREVNSVYAAAIDGLINRGGMVRVSEFAVISGAPKALKKQVAVDKVAINLVNAGILEKIHKDGEDYYVIKRSEIYPYSWSRYKALCLAEDIIISRVREWARNLGFVSYDKVAVRGSGHRREVGAFKWDLCGPSYLLPLKGTHMKGDKPKPGFLVVDVFAAGVMDKNKIRFFMKKIRLLNSSLNHKRILPVIVGDGFDKQAMREGKGYGVVMASTSNLFGNDAAKAIQTLVQTLQNTAAIAEDDLSRFFDVFYDLQKIEGAAGNLRGVLFELISVHLAKDGAKFIEYSTLVTDPETGDKAEIDILRVVNRSECAVIECKGRNPGGTVDESEVSKWIQRLPTIKRYLESQDQYRESSKRFELWTSGSFTKEALKLLEKEKNKRVHTILDWKDGKAVLELAKSTGDKGIKKALNEHFFNHPLAKVAKK